jgi:zinc/manganese transport system permease protein
MNFDAIDLSILLPALAAGLLVTATHVPLGMQVLARGIVFIDLAIAQIAGCGVLLADQLGFEAQGAAVQLAALTAALGGALLLTWTERVWPEVQEAVIGVVFVLAATGSVLLLASNVHGSEHLRDLLVGQILWSQPARLAWAAAAYAPILLLWFGWRERLGRTGFYILFAVAVTVSVQLVGLYLVFTTLIVPPLATRRMTRGRLAAAWSIGAAGYALGLLLSTTLDLPSGPVIVWTLVVLAVCWQACPRRRHREPDPSATASSRRFRRGRAMVAASTQAPCSSGPGLRPEPALHQRFSTTDLIALSSFGEPGIGVPRNGNAAGK